MTCTEQNLSQILLHKHEVWRILLTDHFLTARQPQSIQDYWTEDLKSVSEYLQKAWDTTGNGSLNDLKRCISDKKLQKRLLKNTPAVV